METFSTHQHFPSKKSPQSLDNAGLYMSQNCTQITSDRFSTNFVIIEGGNNYVVILHGENWDKPIWDSSATGGFSMSIFDVSKIGVGFLAGPLATLALSAVHDLGNLAGGFMTAGQFGVSLLKNAIGSIASVIAPTSGQFLDKILDAGINSVANIASTGLHLNDKGNMDWSLSSSQWASAGISSAVGFGAAAFNTGMTWGNDTWSKIGQTAGNWAINSTADVVNRGWKTKADGSLDWQLDESKGEWSAALLSAGVSGVNSAINYKLGGYTGYGANNSGNLLAYGLTKSLDMSKYGAMQSGWLGSGLQDKYNAAGNVFDLAGGLDFTVARNNGKGAIGLQINSQGMGIHSGEGEFGGLAMTYSAPQKRTFLTPGNTVATTTTAGGWGWNGADTLGNTINDIGNIAKGIGSGIGSALAFAGNTLNSAVSYIGQAMMPVGQQTPAQKLFTDTMDNAVAADWKVQQGELVHVNTTEDEKFKYSVYPSEELANNMGNSVTPLTDKKIRDNTFQNGDKSIDATDQKQPTDEQKRNNLNNLLDSVGVARQPINMGQNVNLSAGFLPMTLSMDVNKSPTQDNIPVVSVDTKGQLFDMMNKMYVKFDSTTIDSNINIDQPEFKGTSLSAGNSEDQKNAFLEKINNAFYNPDTIRNDVSDDGWKTKQVFLLTDTGVDSIFKAATSESEMQDTLGDEKNPSGPNSTVPDVNSKAGNALMVYPLVSKALDQLFLPENKIDTALIVQQKIADSNLTRTIMMLRQSLDKLTYDSNRIRLATLQEIEKFAKQYNSSKPKGGK